MNPAATRGAKEGSTVVPTVNDAGVATTTRLGRIMDGRIMDGRIMDGRIMDGRIIGGRVGI
jgi:hypothetical protein